MDSGIASAVGDAEKGHVMRVGRDSVKAGTVVADRVAKGDNVVLLAAAAPEVYNRGDRAATADEVPALASRRRDWIFS